MSASLYGVTIDKALSSLRDHGHEVAPTRWQSIDVSKRREATTVEVLNYTLKLAVEESLDDLRMGVAPNLPWVDDHFAERVSGKALNPGEQWAKWPWGNSANSFRRVDVPGQGKGFDHSYMERYWPKGANSLDWDNPKISSFNRTKGVRFAYGDLGDVVDHLVSAPDSRQAYLPVWFPEDTGKLDVRVPCTLGYHFIHRRGFLHCTYYIRSCDAYRHLRDDIYLTVRLQLWLLEQLRHRDVVWKDVRPGLMTMHIVSLHVFINDYHTMFPDSRRFG